MNKELWPVLQTFPFWAWAFVAASFLWFRSAASFDIEPRWQAMYEVAIFMFVLAVVEIRRRSPLLVQLQMLNGAITRTFRRNPKTPRRLGFRDKLGELAAAFDHLAETLREKEPPAHNDKSRSKDGAEWLPLLAQFSRVLRSCRDVSSVQRALADTMAQAFPGCAVALQISGDTTVIGSQRGGDERNLEPLKREVWHCYARIPLLARGDALGALSLYGRERSKLSSVDLDFLSLLADRAALALEDCESTKQPLRSREGSGAAAISGRADPDFVSIVSHEFRTPLNLIMGYTEMMQEELMGTITAEQHKCLERVMKASDDLLALVNNVLQAETLESGCVEIIKQEVRLTDLVRELQAEFPLPQELEFVWDVAAHLPPVTTDADKLKRVLQQLIGNALKFTERGHVRVSIRSLLPAGNVEITVSDTGIGIAEPSLPALFEKYRQLDSSIARAYGGMGLGLYIAKKLTELLGGELKAISRPGTGSTFTVTLPVRGVPQG